MEEAAGGRFRMPSKSAASVTAPLGRATFVPDLALLPSLLALGV